MNKIPLLAIALLSLSASTVSCAQAQPDKRDPISIESLNKPMGQWTQAERELGFRVWQQRVTTRPVRKGNVVRALPSGAPMVALAPGSDGEKKLIAFTEQHKLAGFLVLQAGAIRVERYALGHSANDTWTSFSVAKSLTSTLVGAALKDGSIKSLDDPIERYIKALKGSGYEGVTVRQLLTMTTGAKWNEDYTDTNADVYKLFRTPADAGLDATTSYMRKVSRGTPPGTKWLYNTGETNLLGILVREATGKPLAAYASEKIWATYGMEQDASWQLDATDAEVAGCCLQATLRDFGRIGQFILEGARIGGVSIVPDGYLEDATKMQADIGAPGRGYGYQWWTRADGTFDAVGIHGQLIHIDRARKLVIVMNSAWQRATGADLALARNAFLDTIKSMLEAESKAGQTSTQR